MKFVRKCATCLSIALLSSLLTYLALHSPPEARLASPATFAIGFPIEKFPILPRFEVPRPYGSFIGDQIPLRLIIETTGDVVVNLANLPQKGQKHGPFEITDMQITRQPASSQSRVYQVAYTLQYFGPTPIAAMFEGVEILYANATERHTPQRPYTYKRLITQPVSINISRLSPLHLTASRGHKGTIEDQRVLSVWIGGIFTTLCFAAASVLGVKSLKKNASPPPHISSTSPPAEEEQDLHVPFYDLLTSHPASLEDADLVQRLRHTLNAHIQTVYGLPAFSMSSAQIAEHLPNHPDTEAIVSLLECCEVLRSPLPDRQYEGEHEICWEAATRFEKGQKVKTT
jgi:hypothetical protein